MRTYYRSLNDVLASPLIQAADTFHRGVINSHRILKSTKLEDAIYRDLRYGDDELTTLENNCKEKLSTFPALCRDIYQSFYSLNVRRNPEESVSRQARRFNAPILEEVMNGEDYPVIKAACEGRQLSAYEASTEFVSQVAANLDDLLEKAGGGRRTLDILERLEQRRDESMEKLQELIKQIAAAEPEECKSLEEQLVKAANRAQSQINQAEAVARIVRDKMIQNKDEISACIAQAGKTAAQKAKSVSEALAAWGYGYDNNGVGWQHQPSNRVRVCLNGYP